MVGELAAAPPPEPAKIPTVPEILAALRKAADRVARGKRDYLVIRPTLMKVHRALNERKVVSPAFRPRVASGKFAGTPTGDQILLDYQLIDMHWLTQTGGDVDTNAQDVVDAIRTDGIFANAAVDFARLKWKMKAKAASFEVTPIRQLGCIMFCRDDLRKRRDQLIREARRHSSQLRQKLQEGVSPTHRSLAKIDIDKVSATWLARELAPRTAASKKPSPATIAKILEMILGKPISAHVVRHQLEQVVRHIDGRSLRI